MYNSNIVQKALCTDSIWILWSIVGQYHIHKCKAICEARRTAESQNVKLLSMGGVTNRIVRLKAFRYQFQKSKCLIQVAKLPGSSKPDKKKIKFAFKKWSILLQERWSTLCTSKLLVWTDRIISKCEQWLAILGPDLSVHSSSSPPSKFMSNGPFPLFFSIAWPRSLRSSNVLINCTQTEH